MLFYYKNLLILFFLSLLISCNPSLEQPIKTTLNIGELATQINAFNHQMIYAAMDKDFNSIKDLYQDDVILAAEYQPFVRGVKTVATYHQTIFQRQDLATYEKEIVDLFPLDSTILEIGEFKQTFKDGEQREGKYTQIWQLLPNGKLQIKVEGFGYYHPLEKAERMVVQSSETPSSLEKTPLEFRAYSALMANSVRERDGRQRYEFYTSDGIFYPFADTPKHSDSNLLQYLIDYNSHPVIIDSIATRTYDYQVVPNGYLQYSAFYVDWTTPDFSGTSKGTGIRYWERQADGSLKIKRQIGMHEL